MLKIHACTILRFFVRLHGIIIFFVRLHRVGEKKKETTEGCA